MEVLLVDSLFDDSLLDVEEEDEVAREDLFPPVDGEEERFRSLPEEDEEDFILDSSATKAGARDLTTASRSD